MDLFFVRGMDGRNLALKVEHVTQFYPDILLAGEVVLRIKMNDDEWVTAFYDSKKHRDSQRSHLIDLIESGTSQTIQDVASFLWDNTRYFLGEAVRDGVWCVCEDRSGQRQKRLFSYSELGELSLSYEGDAR